MTTMHGLKPGGSDRTFFLPWKVSQKQISQAEVMKLRKEGKINITFSDKVAVKMLVDRKKKILYHLENGMYGVRV
jgi:hypothetical protein